MFAKNLGILTGVAVVAVNTASCSDVSAKDDNAEIAQLQQNIGGTVASKGTWKAFAKSFWQGPLNYLLATNKLKKVFGRFEDKLKFRSLEKNFGKKFKDHSYFDDMVVNKLADSLDSWRSEKKTCLPCSAFDKYVALCHTSDLNLKSDFFGRFDIEHLNAIGKRGCFFIYVNGDADLLACAKRNFELFGGNSFVGEIFGEAAAVKVLDFDIKVVDFFSKYFSYKLDNVLKGEGYLKINDYFWNCFGHRFVSKKGPNSVSLSIDDVNFFRKVLEAMFDLGFLDSHDNRFKFTLKNKSLPEFFTSWQKKNVC